MLTQNLAEIVNEDTNQKNSRKPTQMTMTPFIPYGRQSITQTDITAVVEVLQSDWITQGPMIPAFEKAVSAVCGVSHGVAVNSATSALHIGCLALGLGPGCRLWTVPNTFVASANCGRYCGAEVDFVDIDPKTYNLSVPALEKKLAIARERGNLPQVLIPVHFAGQSCDMDAIYSLSQQYNFRIIEDASHAVGAQYRGEPVGNCHYSDITIFSFHPVKIITTGEGGMALTNNPDLAARMSRLRTHGITRDSDLLSGKLGGDWVYEQVELGFNYRVTDIQAALGLSQLQRLPDFIARRRQLAAQYDYLLADMPLILPWQHPDALSAWHLYVVQVKESAKLNREELFGALRRSGIGVQVHYIPVHLQPDYQRLGFREGDFPVAESYYGRAISLPMYPGLSDADQLRVVETLRQVLE
jgi:UDP-4-amino-4,6-dideoxy-N-acetyl-beta-L-altrosamine transaminase